MTFSNTNQYSNSSRGFTIVELLVVIVVIGILASISVVAYASVKNKAIAAGQQSDLELFKKAIIIARTNTGKTLDQLDNSGYSVAACTNAYGYNPSDVEPNQLPKSSSCWTTYYNILGTIGNASGIDLSRLKGGDARGDPYMPDENEGDYPGHCAQDVLYVWSGDGTDNKVVGTRIDPAFC